MLIWNFFVAWTGGRGVICQWLSVTLRRLPVTHQSLATAHGRRLLQTNRCRLPSNRHEWQYCLSLLSLVLTFIPCYSWLSTGAPPSVQWLGGPFVHSTSALQSAPRLIYKFQDWQKQPSCIAASLLSAHTHRHNLILSQQGAGGQSIGVTNI